MKQYTKKAFTLVELIVVVTILAILWTIGFVSYSSYLGGVRDSNRISQLTALSDWLNLYTTRWSLPLPDSSVAIQANGSVLSYQWDAGTTVIETIDYSKWWTDPLDNNFFTYYVTADRRYHQLMGFLEESENLQWFITQSYAAIDLSNRYPNAHGSKLGILLEPVTNTPIQNLLLAGSELDIVTTPDRYTAYLDNENFIFNKTSWRLYALEDAIKKWWRWCYISGNTHVTCYDPSQDIPRNDLVLEHHYESNSADSSGNGHNGFGAGTAAGHIDGQIWQAISSISSASISVNQTSLTDIATNQYSISLWFKSDSLAWDLVNNLSGTTGWYALFLDSGDIVMRHCGGWSCDELRYDISSNFNTSTYYNYSGVFDGDTFYVYWNGKLVTQAAASSSLNLSGLSELSIGGNSFVGWIDALRIYSRALNTGEISNIYNEGK